MNISQIHDVSRQWCSLVVSWCVRVFATCFEPVQHVYWCDLYCIYNICTIIRQQQDVVAGQWLCGSLQTWSLLLEVPTFHQRTGTSDSQDCALYCNTLWLRYNKIHYISCYCYYYPIINCRTKQAAVNKKSNTNALKLHKVFISAKIIWLQFLLNFSSTLWINWCFITFESYLGYVYFPLVAWKSCSCVRAKL